MTDIFASHRVLLLGGGGMLGRAWRQMLAHADVAFAALPHGNLDITDEGALSRSIDGPDLVVINCAAWTDVDGAETHVQEAHRVNGEAVGVMARCCAKAGALLVHYSSDYVFRGDAATPYAVHAPHDPVNAYGASKAAGETAIENSGCRHLLVRGSWLYAPWGKNFVRTIAAAARSRDQLRVVNDQTGRPTSSEHLAAATHRLLDAGATGIYHVTDGGQCTWFDFAAAVVDHLKIECNVTPCTTAEYPRPARRPAYSVMDLGLTERLIGPMPHWRDNLRDVLDRLELLP